MIIQCCVCRVIVQEEDHREPIGEISHTYCPTCYGETLAEIKKEGGDLNGEGSNIVGHKKVFRGDQFCEVRKRVEGTQR